MSEITAKLFMTIMAVVGWGFIALQFWVTPDAELWRRIAASAFSGAVLFGLFRCAKVLFGERW